MGLESVRGAGSPQFSNPVSNEKAAPAVKKNEISQIGKNALSSKPESTLQSKLEFAVSIRENSATSKPEQLKSAIAAFRSILRSSLIGELTLSDEQARTINGAIDHLEGILPKAELKYAQEGYGFDKKAHVGESVNSIQSEDAMADLQSISQEIERSPSDTNLNQTP